MSKNQGSKALFSPEHILAPCFLLLLFLANADGTRHEERGGWKYKQQTTGHRAKQRTARTPLPPVLPCCCSDNPLSANALGSFLISNTGNIGSKRQARPGGWWIKAS
jgi:hypothetical protein